jgi:hypothetical protein
MGLKKEPTADRNASFPHIFYLFVQVLRSWEPSKSLSLHDNLADVVKDFNGDFGDGAELDPLTKDQEINKVRMTHLLGIMTLASCIGGCISSNTAYLPACLP